MTTGAAATSRCARKYSARAARKNTTPTKNTRRPPRSRSNIYSAQDARESKERVLGRLYQRAVELHGAAHERTLDYATRLAACLQVDGKYREARSFLQEPIAAARRASVPDSVPLLKLRWTYASACAKDPGASLEMLIETTPLLEGCVLTARRLLGDEHEVTVIGNRVLLEHVDNVAKAKARRVLARFVSRLKARRGARLRAT
jgi:hypothetical protein